jgi:hypothetical protein
LLRPFSYLPTHKCRYVLNKYGTTLDDVEGALEAQRRAYAAAHDEGLPLFDRLAIRLAFSYLLQYSAAGRRPSAAALSSAADTLVSAAAYSSNGGSNGSNGAAAAAAAAGYTGDATGSSDDATGSSDDGGSGSSSGVGARGGIFATTAAVARRAGGRSAEAASVAARKGMEMLQKIPLPILSRSTDDEEAASADAQEVQKQQYVLTQAEERLVQVRVGSSSSSSSRGLR